MTEGAPRLDVGIPAWGGGVGSVPSPQAVLTTTGEERERGEEVGGGVGERFVPCVPTTPEAGVPGVPVRFSS